MKKTIIVMGTKGGAGKTHLVTQFLPLALFGLAENIEDLQIDLALIDSNNKQGYKPAPKSKVKIVQKIKATSKFNVDMLVDFFKFNYMNFVKKDNHFLLVDVGGGEDTNIMIDVFSKIELEDSIIAVPFFLTEEYVSGLITTIKKIREKSPLVDIVAVAINKEQICSDEAEAREIPLKTVMKEHLHKMLDNNKPDEEYILGNTVDILALDDLSEVCANAKDGQLMFDSVFDVVTNEKTFLGEMKPVDAELRKTGVTEDSKEKYTSDRNKLLAKYSFVDAYNFLKKEFIPEFGNVIKR